MVFSDLLQYYCYHYYHYYATSNYQSSNREPYCFISFQNKMDVEPNVQDTPPADSDDDGTPKQLRITSITGQENQTITADKSQVNYSANNSNSTNNFYFLKRPRKNKNFPKRLSDGRSKIPINLRPLLEEESSLETESSQASDSNVVTIHPPAGMLQ